MRCFLALVPDGNGLEQLETITRPLRQWDLPAYWQHTEDFHLTLCFLGSNDQQELHGIHYAIDELAGSLIKPQLSLSGLGAFGGKTYPKNLFVGINDPEHRCVDYHHNLCEALSMRPESHYKPHMRLCRPRGQGERISRDWSDMITAFGTADWGPINMTHLALYHSRQPKNGGQRYHAVHKWPLLENSYV